MTAGTGPAAPAALADLWTAAGGDPGALARVRLEGDDPVLPGVFRVGAAALASIGAAGLAAAELLRLRTGRTQTVSVDVRLAAAAFRSERYLRIGAGPAPVLWDPLAGYYATGDGGFVQLHTNFAHHRAAALHVIGCAATREAVSVAVARRDGGPLEDDLAAAGACAGLVRPAAAWRAHPQGQAVATRPLVEIVRFGDAPPEPAGDGRRPLGGVRVLDLTRIIAGPVAGRTLTEHGADVLLVTGPHLPSIEVLTIDTGRGKRAAHLDLRQAEDAARLRALVRAADVVVQAYRPGALAARGFGPEALAALRPGLVYVSLSAYGHAGPWRDRRGFDSLVQTVSGIAHEGQAATGAPAPLPLPAQALDHATGYLAAFGAMMALGRRAREGGSYLVRLSLARTGAWLDGLGRADGLATPDPGLADVADCLETTDTPPWGAVTHVRPAADLSLTPARWARPAAPLGSHPPAWSPDPTRPAVG